MDILPGEPAPRRTPPSGSGGGGPIDPLAPGTRSNPLAPAPRVDPLAPGRLGPLAPSPRVGPAAPPEQDWPAQSQEDSHREPSRLDPLAPPPVNVPPEAPPGAPQPRKRIGAGRLLSLVVVAIMVVGGVATRAFREASASPQDLAACTATIGAIESDMRTAPTMISALRAAESEDLKRQAMALTLAARDRNNDAFVNSINRVIDFCGPISRSFRDRWDGYCSRNPDACERRGIFG